MAFVACHETAEVLKPREETFDFPATAITAELAAILGDVAARGTMRRDELDAPTCHAGIERVAVIAAIANEPLWQASQEALLQDVINKSNLTRGRTCGSNGERKTSSVCDCHDLGAFPFAGKADGGAPFFAPAKVASMNASVKS